ncbi:hypothetical protein ABQ431_03785 [Serratia fonticola]|uniref:hypothetical protein n=1 Tax=Serratia fonticola TaxID=47917 RepID=UPI003AB0DA23
MANPLAKTKANNEPYRKVKITMWNDPKFRALSPLPPSGQSLFVYLLTGPFTGIIPGLFKAGRAALAEELGWEVEAFDLALGEALTLGMVKADTQARVFWLPNAAKHNPPTSVNVIKSWVRAFELLPECNLKYEALESLRAASHGVSKAMGLAFDKAFTLAKPLPKDMPNALPRPFQKAVSSKQILNPTHGAYAHEGNFSPDDQPFPMFQNWRPVITQWPEVLPDIFAAALADFVVFWQAERSELQQSQWEQKFERSLAQFLQQNTSKQSRGSNANVQTTDPLQQVRAARNAERARCGLEPLGDDGEDLFPTVAPEERHHTLDGLGSDDFKALE